MRFINFGSINLDHVYHVDHILRPGETLSSNRCEDFTGGKGANQSCAMARAGGKVYHAGQIGEDGRPILCELQTIGIDTTYIEISNHQTGHAIIQIDSSGENAILLFGGANHHISKEHIDRTIEHFDASDILVLQNEINHMEYLIQRATQRNISIAFNPAPMSPEVHQYPLRAIRYLIVNETEGKELSGATEHNDIMNGLQSLCPQAEIVMTLGAEGACFRDLKSTFNEYVPCCSAQVVDTTAAGDTFTGYYLVARSHGHSMKHAVKKASSAASITVSRAGALCSIPKHEEVPK